MWGESGDASPLGIAVSEQGLEGGEEASSLAQSRKSIAG